ncbi:MAG: hypothetical protein WC609_02895 [Candidatus Paceibacterota bacterium]|jgi:hypothetical protein
MQKRNVLNSPRLLDLKKRRRKVILVKIILFALVFVFVFGSLAFLSGLKSLNINSIEITGNKIIETEMIRTAVEQTIYGKYLWLFPKSNLLIYPKNSIKHNLQNSFRRIGSIDLTIKDSQTLVVNMTEREAKYVWCGDVLPEANDDNQKCYFMDSAGYLFDEAPYFSGEVYFKFYGKVDAPLGAYYFKQYFEHLIAFKEALVNMGLRPVALYIINYDEAHMFLSRGTSLAEPKIIFNPSGDFKNTEENLDAALNTEPLLSKFKNEYSSLQYIDLRFGNKVYDKFQ